MSGLDWGRLAKLCGMFGSDHAGERANAAETADRLVKEAGLLWWPDVITPAAPTPPDPYNLRGEDDAIALLHGAKRFSDAVGAEFVLSLAAQSKRPISPKQQAPAGAARRQMPPAAEAARMTAPLDTVTVLTAQGRKILAKRHRRLPNGGGIVTTSYDKATMFRLSQRPVSSIDDVAELLRELAGKPSSCIVRGDPAPDVDWGKPQKRRLKTRRKADGTVEPATLISAARRLIQLDFDRLECPPEIDQYDEPDRVVDHVIALLPEPFHGTTCCWDFTGSAGIKPGISLRLRFWADRPVTDEELKIWLADSPVDHSIFAPAQPIYTAAPIFEGMPDPVPFRSGTRTGYSDEVAVPAIERPQRASTSGTSSAGNAGGMGGGGYAAHRGRIGDGPLRNGFLAPIKSAVAAWIGEAGAGADTAWLRADLEQAIREAPRDPGKHPDDYVENRVADLDPLIAAIRGFQAEKEAAAAEPCEPTYPAPLGSVAEAREVICRGDGSVRRCRAGMGAAGRAMRTTTESPTAAAGACAQRRDRHRQDAGMARARRPAADRGRQAAGARRAAAQAGRRDRARPGRGRHHRARLPRARGRSIPTHRARQMCRDLARVKRDRGRARQRIDACLQKQRGRMRVLQGLRVSETAAATARGLGRRRISCCSGSGPHSSSCDALAIDEGFHGAALHGIEKQFEIDLDLLIEADRTVPNDAFATTDLTEISSARASARSRRSQRGGCPARAARTCVYYGRATVARRFMVWNGAASSSLTSIPACRRSSTRPSARGSHRTTSLSRKLARFWRLLKQTLEAPDERSPWLELRHKTDEDGEMKIIVAMAWRDDIHKSWHVPTLVMDATMPVEIVRQFFPQMEEPVSAPAPMPHTRVRQITDRAMAASMLIPSARANDRTNATRRNNVERVRRYHRGPRRRCAAGAACWSSASRGWKPS